MRKKSNATSTARKNAFFGTLSGILVAAAMLVFTMPVAADDFDEAVIYFELNDTDEDLGIHALIDGEPWKRLEIEDPNERRMLRVNVRGRLRRQGLTEFFFESAEPTFGELSPEAFFIRFPEGIYEIEGLTLEGEELEGEAKLSHVMPAPPENVRVNGIEAAEDCEAVLPAVSAPVIISWDDVDTNHPDVGRAGDVVVQNYEVVVEIDETPWKMSAILSSGITSFQVPQEILDMADEEVKFEVLVRAANHNQTAVESCFVIEE